ncbi:hypothetical protein OAU28_01475 [Flavobacteriales bacterium]|jgi:hypothetical protein|nr:hypothetical protein [Flavobacteriales bacterium]
MADRKNINPRRPIPSSQYDKLRENLSSGFADGFPVNNFPNPDNRFSINKANHTTRKDDTIQDISIGLQDHDEAIMYYFNNVIKPSVIVNGDRTNVPVIYGAPERWKAVQKDGYFRDKEGKLQVPLIMFKRDSIERRRDLGNKIDANNPQLYYSFQEKYSKRNRYDNFSVLQGKKPQIEKYAVVIPDYIKIQYTCTIWTDFVAQNNKLIEMINYSSDTYWGDPERFNFNARIDSYNNTTEVTQGEDRIVKTDFGLSLQGYLVPDSLNQEIASGNINKSFTRSKITFNSEISSIDTNSNKTREEVRNTSLGQKVQQVGLGIGYQQVGLTNQIA